MKTLYPVCPQGYSPCLKWWSRSVTTLFILFLFGFTQLQAQTRNISGVVDDITGGHLCGVSVVIKGTTKGTTTDVNGGFKLEVPKDATLIFSFIGYSTQELAVGTASTLTIKMSTSSIGLDEVVVVGYGTQSRRTVTSAITKVSGETFDNIPISSVGEGLKGKIAGARVYSNDFTPGADPTIRIRGGSSINKSNEPLILVDGVERSFSGINPNDIESIDVLKDAASTAIYGSRGSNGVVLVTTKAGKVSAAPQIVFDASWAVQSVETLYDMMNAEDYIRTVRSNLPYCVDFLNTVDTDNYSASSGNTSASVYSTRYLKDGEMIPRGYKSMIDPLDPSKTLIFQDTDWQKEMYSPSLWQNYYIGVSGGSENSKYMASIGYTSDDGVALSTGYDRFVGRISLQSTISKRIKFRASADYSQTNSDEYPNQKNVISRGLSAAPTMKLYFDDGTPTYGYNATSLSPLYYDYITQRHNWNNRVSAIGGLTVDIIDGLKADAQASLYNHQSRSGSFTNANYFSSNRPASEDYSKLLRSKFETYLSYNKTFANNHTLSATGGYSYSIDDRDGFGADAEGASSDKVPTLSASPIKTNATSSLSTEVLIGYFGRLSYDFKKKYMVSATFRADGSSKFAPGEQWGYFPGVSAGWMVSEEKFMQSIPQISSLKVRTSYGQTGNNAIGLYDALGQYSTNRYNGNAGMFPSKMPNVNLTWEVTDQFDAGIDLGLFDERLAIKVDYFNKITKNLLFSKDMPNTSGFANIQTNIGKVRFRGFDFEISSKNIKTKNFSWTTDFSWSYVKNVVLELPDNGRDRNRIGGTTMADGTAFGGTAEGEPLFRYYGPVASHILQTPQDAANALWDSYSKGYDPITGISTKGQKFPGDYEWVNRPGSAKRTVNGREYDMIDAEDKFLLGYTVPHTTGGLNNTFRYKSFTFTLFVDWALGHSILNTTESRSFINTFTNNTALSNKVLECWQGPGDTDAKYAKFQPGGEKQSSNFRTSGVFNYKGDYLCIREVSLVYNVPKSIASKLGMQGLSVVVAGNNLHYFTEVEGVSPEVGTSDTYNDNYNNYPPIRRVSLGLKVTF